MTVEIKEKIVVFFGKEYWESQVRDGLLIYENIDLSYWDMPLDKDLWKERYAEYLRTDRWASLKSECLDRYSGECGMCSNKASLVHHRHYLYGRFGEEGQTVLIAICKSCHHKHHKPYAGLDEVREEILEAAKTKSGTKCPVCDRICKVYKRKLNSRMAAAVVWMVNNFDKDWIDIPNSAPRFIVRTGGQYGTLRYWGLIEQKPNDDDPKKKGSGLWRPTELGIKFVNREKKIPTHVYLYNNEVKGFTEELMSIDEALGESFDYEELMSEDSLDLIE
jgi:5-methylcytosine-specific restriction endonuclease McrA